MPWYSCALHIHTLYSDGTAGVGDLIPRAKKSGIDVLLVTDHHTMAAKRFGQTGWQDGVLVIVGYEHSDIHDENHLLVFGIDEPISPDLDAATYVREVRKKGGISFLAHPTESRSHHPKMRAYPWTASLDLPFDGIEVWNYLSSWAEGLSPRSIPFDYLFPDRDGGRPDKRAVRIWDRIAEQRSIAGVAGLDAHAKIHRWGFFRGRIFPYVHGFKRIRTCIECDHPLSGKDVEADTIQVLSQLAQGCSIMGNNRIGPLESVHFAFNGHERAHWGHTIRLSGSIDVKLLMGSRASVCLWRSGKPDSVKRGRSVRFRLRSPGIYRITATRFGAMWFMTNHLRLRDRDDGY